MVRGSLGGRETTWGSKRVCLDDSLHFSPHLTPPVCLPPLSVCFLACPWVVLSSWHDQWPRPAPDCQVWVHSPVTRGELCSSPVFWWADEESAGAHHRDEGAHFFHRSALDGLLSPCTSHQRPLTKIISLKLCFLSFSISLIPPSSGFVQGHLKETFLLGSWGTGSLVGKFVCLKPTCVFLDRVVWCRKRGVLAAKCWLGWLHQENIKRPFMRCCKEERVFWEHHQTARVIPLFKMCPEDTGLSHLLPFLLCLYPFFGGAIEEEVWSVCVCWQEFVCHFMLCHSQKSRVFSLALLAAMSTCQNIPLYIYVWSQIICVHHVRWHMCPSPFHDFLLVLTEGCKFLEGCVCVC